MKVIQDLKSKGILMDNLEKELQTKEERYREYVERKTEKGYMYDKIINQKFGEQPNMFFCNLEKNMSAQKYIGRLKVMKEGVEVTITDQE